LPKWARELSGQQRDAYAAITGLFKSYGLESLSGKIFDFVKKGYSADTISVLLQETKEYKERFAGNEIRRKQGLPVLNPGEYLATEASYKQIMQAAGMPPGFYDQSSDFNNWIGKNISPSEIQSRVDMATQATVLANPEYRRALNQMGVSNSDLTAYFLDTTRAMPYLQKAAATAAVGAEALRSNMKFDQAYAEKLALEGVTQEQAKTGYTQIAMEQQALGTLGEIYGSTYGQRQAEEAIIRGQSDALRRRQDLINQEKGSFSGAAGAARGGLAQRGGQR
jgi:predicted Ser/Thr protein kinase